VLTDDNFKVAPLNLTISATIPLSNSLLIVADPQSQLTPSEYQSVVSYLGKGGRMVLMANAIEPYADGCHAKNLGSGMAK
jgi:predicted ribonuclease YlaK